MRNTLYFLVLSFALLGCGTKVYKRGHVISPEASAQIPKLRTKQEVFQTLGTPGAVSPMGQDDVWFYLSYEKEQTAFLTPEDTKYDLIYFRFPKNKEKVSEIKRFDLAQKKDLDIQKETTPIPGIIELNPLEEMFKNVGKFNPIGNGGL